MKKWFPYTDFSEINDNTIAVFGLSHSGGGASIFKSWNHFLPRSIQFIPVQIPGRETRIQEDFITSMEVLSSQLAAAILACFSGPVALYGHSLGGAVAFEVACQLAASQAKVERVFISACSFPSMENRQSQIHCLDDKALSKVVVQYGGTPDQLLDNQEFLTFILPRVRADFTLFENHILKEIEPQNFPISLFGGSADEIASESELKEWQQTTLVPVTFDLFEGDHFFHLKSGWLVCDRIAHLLQSPKKGLLKTGKPSYK